jgi:hypothetical protein
MACYVLFKFHHKNYFDEIVSMFDTSRIDPSMCDSSVQVLSLMVQACQFTEHGRTIPFQTIMIQSSSTATKKGPSHTTNLRVVTVTLNIEFN